MSNSVDPRRLASLTFIAALAVLFALQWGPGSRGCDTGPLTVPDSVATVNGSPISARDFAREYVNQAEQFRRQGIPTEMLKQFGVDKQVLDRLVNTELLAQAAEKKGLSASDDDLKKLYAESPIFQKDGRFDHDTFADYVRRVENTTEVKFEDKLRRQLAAQRLLQLVESSAVVSGDEVRARYVKEGDAAKIAYVRFVPTMFADQLAPPTRAELVAWQKANDLAIAAFYEQNKFTYSVPEKVKARQLLLKVAADATATVKAEAKARAEALRKDVLETKKPFADVAREASDDTETRESGGDLGLVERLALPAAFADALFALQPGEVTAPVETPMGYFLGTIEEKRAPEQRTLDQVRDEIAAQLFLKERSKARARAEAEKALAEVKKGKTLAELFPAAARPAESNPFGFTAETKPEVKETAEFSASADAIPTLGPSEQAMKAIFARTAPGQLEQLFEVGDAVTLITVTERRLPSDTEFEKQQSELTLQAVKAKQFEVREAFLKSLKQGGTVVTNEQAITKVLGTDS